MSETGPDDVTFSRRMMWAIALLGIAMAALPHAFFAPPLQLHMEGNLRGFYGISVWMPAILGGIAFFVGVDLKGRLRKPASDVAVTSLAVTAPIVFALLLAFQYQEQFSGMAGMRPWDELMIALPLYFVLGVLPPLFWQGLLQGKLLADRPPLIRILTVTGAATFLWVPFVLETGFDDAPYLLTAAAGAGLLAWVYELGFTVRLCAFLGGVMGALFVWFQQVMFL